jgi:putative addiction module killer protein
VYQIQETERFAVWFSGLRDNRGKARILSRLDAARLGHFGDVKSVGGGVSELRVDTGPGYRVYFARRRGVLVVLLCGGDKSTQAKDIAVAKRMAGQIE